MATTPTQVLELRSTALTAGATTNVTSASFTPAVGDVLVIKGTTNVQTVVPQTPTSSAPANLTAWVPRVSVTPTTGCPAMIWTARVLVSAALTVTVPVASTSAGTGTFEGALERWANVTIGATAPVSAVGTPSGSITTTVASSAVTWVAGDYNGNTGAAAYLSGATADFAAYQSSTVLSAYNAYQAGPATPGAQTFGISAPTGGTTPNYSLGALELVPAGPGTAIVNEDASTPPVVRGTYGTATAVTSASFTPPANSVLLVLAVVGWGTNPTGTPAVTVTDSAGGTWTKPTDLFTAATATELVIATRSIGATPPGAITVTATSSSATAKTIVLAVRVLTGTTGLGTPATTPTADAVSLTTTAVNSLVYVVAGNGTNSTAAANANTLSLLNLGDSSSGDTLLVGEGTGRIVTPGALTLGWTGIGTTGTGAPSAAIEVLPGLTTSPLASLVDSFTGGALSGQWIANGAGVSGGGAYVNVSQNAGAAVFSSLRSQPNYTWSSSSILFEIGSMPGNASNTANAGDAANAQFWVRDPNPANTVDRLGVEYSAQANTLNFRGQTYANGQAYQPIGTDTVLPYDPVAHRWLRMSLSAGGVLTWDTSPDGLTWTTQRTLTGAPTWTTKTTLQLSIEGFRTTGTNDVVRIDNVNAPPAALPSTAPSGADLLQTRTLTEVRAWETWLANNSARGYVGEFGWVTLWSKFGDSAQGAKWSGLGGVYLTELDYAGLSGTVWAAGRNWGNGYTLGSAVGNNVGDALTIFNTDASPIPAHRTRGAGAATRWRGVGLSGYERGMNIAGGGTVRSATPYVHTAADFAFMAANGIDTVRLALAWERVQPTLGAALSTTALADVDGMLTAARQVGIRVFLDIHNYGRYTQSDGTTVVSICGGGITDAQFSNLWTSLSTWVMGNPTRSGTVIGYGLMNEPHDLPGGAAGWQTTSQAALTAIRGNADTRLITVAGYQFASLTSWSNNHPSGWITDTGGPGATANFLYEAHHYWDTVSAYGSRSGTYQQRNADNSISTETYATELASCSPTTTTDLGTGAEQGVPVETVADRPQGPIESPSSTEEGSPGGTIVGDTVIRDVPRGAEAGSERETAIPNSAAFDVETGAEQGVEPEAPIETTILHETPEGSEPGSPGEVELALPPTLTAGQVGPTELDLTVADAPQVSEATLRLYGWLGSAFIDGDAAAGYPLLRFCEAPGRLLQNIEDLTRDANVAPGWSAIFDLTRAPTYALPWMGQTVGVTVDPTIPDAAQRQQIISESGYKRGTRDALTAVALSWLQGPMPTVDVIERDGNPWTVTVAVYAAQLVGRTYASLGALYPTYIALSAAYSAYQGYAVGYSELYAALEQVKPAGLILNLVVRTGPSYDALTHSFPTYPAFSASYPTYAAATGALPVTS